MSPLEKLLKWLEDKKRGYQIGSPEYDQMPHLGTRPEAYGWPGYYQAEPSLPNFEVQWDKLRKEHEKNPGMMRKIERAQDTYNTNLAPILSRPFWNQNAKEEWLGRALNDPQGTLREMEKLERQGIHPFTVKSL